jgi:hypothetical protein
MWCRVVSVFWLLAAMACVEARAQTPPPDILRAIVAKVAEPSSQIVFKPARGASSSICRMRPFDMQLMQDGNLARSYSILMDTDPAGSSVPKDVLAVVSRFTIDADGSPRAYHPEDPDGRGVCDPERRADGSTHMRGICALDRFANAGLRVFRNTDVMEKDDLVREWAVIWPYIRDRRLQPVELHTVAGSLAPRDYYLFYLPDRRLTAVFRETVITKDNAGYPCRHGPDSAYPGYFVAATTLNHIAPYRSDGCAPGRFLDSESVPYTVLPKGNFGDVEVGDVMVARLSRAGMNRMVFGIVAEAGRPDRLGEGSIALNAALLGKEAPARSMKDTWNLDISTGQVAILVFGGTHALLNGNYSRQNVETVARQEFTRWNGGAGAQRLEACIAEAPVNPK